jgi:hypothetical protein
MGYQNREKEVKMLVIGCSDRAKLDRICRRAFKPISVINKVTRTDFFWKARGADFTRIRQMGTSFTGWGQMTVKKTDRGDISDRIEIDLEVKDVGQAVRLKICETGKKPRTITKTYTILFLDTNETNISVYQVKGSKHVFIEVEARTSKVVQKVLRKLHKAIPFEMKRMQNSLYDMFVKGVGRP